MKFVKIPKVEVLTLDLAMAKEYENNNEFDYFDIEEIQKERLARGEWEQQLAEKINCIDLDTYGSNCYDHVEINPRNYCSNCKVRMELKRQAKEDKQGEIKK